MEDELDAVSRGEEDWRVPLEKFWKPFIDLVEHTEKNVSREAVAQARDLGVDPASGKPVSVRMGRFGPFVQIGTKDDEEKPRFAGLRPGQKMDRVTLDEALYLFQLPRTLGATAEGETVTTSVGRFGPYVKYGAKYVSLKDADPYTVTLEHALEVIRLKQIADANRIIRDFTEEKIQVLNGRYGPYVSDGVKNARIPKDRDPKSLTLEDCRTLLAQAPARAMRGRGRAAGKAAPAAAPAAAAVAPAAPAAQTAPKTRARKPAAKIGKLQKPQPLTARTIPKRSAASKRARASGASAEPERRMKRKSG
jgi:DNA topoisomerase-1